MPGLTNRMRARLQGFPNTWEFVGEIGPVADQIGKAVVPAMAQAMMDGSRPSRREIMTVPSLDVGDEISLGSPCES
ncbi:DNA cytosine methyltransferase [Agrobacterium sp. rho-8.1]|nr:DNA cytosine methyltransferase [Agrobacterium sp. rho-8.1]